MKEVTLKSFIHKKFSEYLARNYQTSNLKKAELILLAKKDFRLKMLAASLYAAKGQFKSAKLFNPKYVDMETFMTSNDKYV